MSKKTQKKSHIKRKKSNKKKRTNVIKYKYNKKSKNKKSHIKRKKSNKKKRTNVIKYKYNIKDNKLLGGFNIGHFFNIFNDGVMKTYQVHQILTKDAWEKAKNKCVDIEKKWLANSPCFKEEYLIHGVKWNDLPRDDNKIIIDEFQCENLRPAKIIALSKTYIKEKLYKKSKSKMWNAHYGTTQHYHSMKSNESSEFEVLFNIYKQLIEWYKKSIYNIDNIDKLDSFENPGRINFLGRILHTIQDSYSKSHTNRDSNYNIIEFYSYKLKSTSSENEKDAKKNHFKYDSLEYLEKETPDLKIKIIDECSKVCERWINDVYKIKDLGYSSPFKLCGICKPTTSVSKKTCNECINNMLDLLEKLSEYRIKQILYDNYKLKDKEITTTNSEYLDLIKLNCSKCGSLIDDLVSGGNKTFLPYILCYKCVI